MRSLSRAHEEHLKELLLSSALPRDAIPYTSEFTRLKEEFWNRSFRKMPDAEFWQALVGVGKRGGAAGKKVGEPAPDLTPEQTRRMLELLPLPLGQRDRLPYTDAFSKMVQKLNYSLGLGLSERQVWLAILRAAK